MRPKLDDEVNLDDALPPLPSGVTIVDMFADVLGYLLRCTKEYIEQSHASGGLLWSTLEKHTHLVLTHPNGWGGLEQNQLKKAAIKAGFFPNLDAADTQLSFVTEGETGLHYCNYSGLSKDAFKVATLCFSLWCPDPWVIGWQGGDNSRRR